MKELLDFYDENGNFLGVENRNIVHSNALWHNTVHCWLFDLQGNVYFQRRLDTNTLYTTASGHVFAGESIKQGFGREIFEELGVKLDYHNSIACYIDKFIMDKKMKDGSIFKDRAFANVYIYKLTKDFQFKYDKTEISELVKINALKTLEMFESGTGKIDGVVIRNIGDKNLYVNKIIGIDEFLITDGETCFSKYGRVLKKIIENV